MAITTVVLALKQGVLDHALQSAAILLLLVPIIYIVANEFIRVKARIAKLDGPRGLPLIGNLWDIRANAAERYRRWAQEFGAVYQIQLGNVPIVVVNTSAAAKVLFGQHAQALSSRPEFYTFHKVLSETSGTTIGTSPYSDSLKRRRKGAASALNRPSVSTYVPHLDVESRDFIKELYEYGKAGQEPVDSMPMIQRLSLSLALTLNWGVRMSSQKDGLFKEITHVEEEISRFRSTTGNLQDYIPLLRLNPINMQSARAREMRNRRDVYLAALNRSLDERMADGTHKPCIQANVIMDKEAKLNKAELTSISLTMLSGGLDTLTTQVAWFVAMLAQRPDIQDKAVAAIRDLYSEKQPMCDAKEDQECKYIVALVKESLRYYTVLRLALPRASVRDVPYGQTIIPKGSVIFLNAWACNMDSELWPDPEVFRPERWLERPDAPLFTYGIGYRMCTGYILANRELYIVYMRLLNSFKVEKYDDVDHHPVSGNADPTSLVSMPRPYRAKFVPRDINTLREVLYDSNQKA
ncbi:cytochrome P450 [Colletotrichum navitas]|uniref:Cytochrome P450 n=1 Tax=Colletotrichum navitas TaxID=681940 RepID=A0AAD8PWX1_9PEZI|nr:cytochrome P450 [Colletotrichum navitas]KAK1585569.1 cytochrome P450 [Colletotrichum navitas]